MPLPATTAALKAWLVDVTLSTVAPDLGWTSASAPVEAAVDVTALVLGHTVEVEAAGGATAKLLAIAEWQAWEQAVKALTSRFDAGSGGDTAKLSQAYDHAVARLTEALVVAQRYSEVVTYLAIEQVTVTTPFFFGLAAGGRGA